MASSLQQTITSVCEPVRDPHEPTLMRRSKIASRREQVRGRVLNYANTNAAHRRYEARTDRRCGRLAASRRLDGRTDVEILLGDSSKKEPERRTIMAPADVRKTER